MIKNIQYIKLQEVVSRVLRNPKLKKCVTLEDAILYAIDFTHKFAMPDMFEDKDVIIPIQDYRGELPCDLIAINQVKDTKTCTCLRSMTSTFYPEHTPDMGRHAYMHRTYHNEMTFKARNHTLFTSFPEGEVMVSYKSIPVDEDGYPLLIDNATYLKALELYIKVEAFTILFDLDEVSAAVLLNAQSQYAWAAGQVQSEFNIPSESEMESIMRNWTSLVEVNTHFDDGFKSLGNRNYIRRH